MGIKDNAKRSVQVAKEHLKYDKFELAVNALEHDIADRGGLKNEWRQIDSEIQKEIKETWKEILREVFEERM